MQADTFDLSDPLEKIVNGWVWIVLLGAIGVLIGLGFNFFFPPRYEAASTFAINVVYGITEDLELVIEDRALDRVWQLTMSDETLQNTVTLLEVSAGQNPSWESIDALKKHIRLDTRLSRWELIGIHRDPATATQIANTWRKVTLDYLVEALDHAWNAYSIDGVVFDLECVKLLREDSTQLHLWSCINSGPGVSPEDRERFQSEVEASRGILPIFNFEILEIATVPEKPVLWPRGLIAFFGGLIGLLIGTILILLRPSFFQRGTLLSSSEIASNSERSGQHLD
jgi:capsular polysaccharide biosynthesis protein